MIRSSENDFLGQPTKITISVVASRPTAFSNGSLPRSDAGVDICSRKQNASKQKTGPSVLIQSESTL